MFARNENVYILPCVPADYEPPVVQQCTGPNATIYSSDTQAYVDWVQPEFIDNSGLAVKLSSDKTPGYYRIGEWQMMAEIYSSSFYFRGCNEMPHVFVKLDWIFTI